MAAEKQRAARRPSRRSEIVTAALAIARERGTANMTATDVARAVAMSATAIRYHFPTDDDLLHAMLDGFLDALETALATEPSKAEWIVGAEQAVASYAGVILAHREAALLVHDDPRLRRHPAFGGRLTTATSKVRHAIAGPEATPAQEAAAMAAVGGIWRPIQMLAPGQVEEHLPEIINVILTGHPDRD